MNDQTLSTLYTVSEFDDEIKSLETLSSKTEKLFVSLTPEEQHEHDREGVPLDKLQTSIHYQRR